VRERSKLAMRVARSISLLLFFSGYATALVLPTRRRLLQVAQTIATTGLIQPSAMAANPDDPSRLLLTSEGKQIVIPRIGYSLYKTDADQVEKGIQLALEAGTRHFDVASEYGTNDIVGQTLKEYVIKGSLFGRQARRNEIFITHKVSNREQSTDTKAVQQAVLEQRKILGLDKLDLVMIHSPLTNKSKRLATYEALLELQAKGKVGGVGVCHYGVNPLEEIVSAGLPAPLVIQLVLSPFNQHKDVATWAKVHGSVLSCSAWSKLSSQQGPQKGWAVVADIAKDKAMTKQQVLIRWAVQRGYLCVPRSSSKYKIEKQAIAENSWAQTSQFVLTAEEMKILDGLDEQLPAGRLGVKDGWEEADIIDEKWDPTLAV